MSDKIANLKEKFRLALTSTAKVISDDFDLINKLSENDKKKDLNSIEIDNLTKPSDFIKLRAETDSSALKKKFSNETIYRKNLPSNNSSRSLYNIAEKIRYEALGGKMLKGIEKNFQENYSHIINTKRKDQLKTKEDVPVTEAFELYMLKNFHQIKLNPLTSKMLNFWEKDFEQSIEKHKKFLQENLENQDNYGSRFSQILEEMDIFQSEEDDEKTEENQDQGQDNPSNDEQNKDNEDNKDENNDQETQASLDADYNVDEFNLDEQLSDTESDEQSSEQIVQKNLDNINLDYKIFTTQYDEVTKAEKLENADEAAKDFEKLSDSVGGVDKQVEDLNKNAKGSVSGFKKMSSAAKGLGTAFKAAGIGLVVAGLALGTFTRSSHFSDGAPPCHYL